jgi:hypothetical protein
MSPSNSEGFNSLGNALCTEPLAIYQRLGRHFSHSIKGDPTAEHSGILEGKQNDLRRDPQFEVLKVFLAGSERHKIDSRGVAAKSRCVI